MAIKKKKPRTIKQKRATIYNHSMKLCKCILAQLDWINNSIKDIDGKLNFGVDADIIAIAAHTNRLKTTLKSAYKI